MGGPLCKLWDCLIPPRAVVPKHSWSTTSRAYRQAELAFAGICLTLVIGVVMSFVPTLQRGYSRRRQASQFALDPQIFVLSTEWGTLSPVYTTSASRNEWVKR